MGLVEIFSLLVVALNISILSEFRDLDTINDF
jgi:hypothetical protein